jgi:hypothetical protein
MSVTRFGRNDAAVVPWWPAGASGASALVAVALVALDLFVLQPVSIPLVVVGYVLGALATTAFAATYRALRDGQRRKRMYRVPVRLNRVVVAATCVGVLAGIGNAVLLATELAK